MEVDNSYCFEFGDYLLPFDESLKTFKEERGVAQSVDLEPSFEPYRFSEYDDIFADPEISMDTPKGGLLYPTAFPPSARSGRRGTTMSMSSYSSSSTASTTESAPQSPVSLVTSSEDVDVDVFLNPDQAFSDPTSTPVEPKNQTGKRSWSSVEEVQPSKRHCNMSRTGRSELLSSALREATDALEGLSRAIGLAYPEEVRVAADTPTPMTTSAPLGSIYCGPQPIMCARQRLSHPAARGLVGRPTTLGVMSHKELPPCSIKISPGMEQVWYAERPYPAFTVDIVHNQTTDTVRWLHSLTHGLKVTLSMVDANGNDVSEMMKCVGAVGNPSYVVVDGTSTITGIRFAAVSSKFGGAFRLVVGLTQFGSPICQVQSEPIQVLSYRLYHSPKVSFENMKPDDSVAKMKGIGSQYSKRFQAIGIQTVAQLAALNLSSLSSSDTRTLLGNLRKDRGTMTLAKLTEYVEQASGIVSRHMQRQNATAHQSTPMMSPIPDTTNWWVGSEFAHL